MTPEDADKLTALVLVVLVALAAIVLLRSIFRRARRDAEAEEGGRPSRVVPAVGPDGTDAPRCVCGAVAVEPTPTLQRGRGTVLRDLFGLPPRYRRVVPRGAALVWCSSHAHVADALLAEFCAAEIRAAFSKAYAAVAARAAVFEQEDLPRRVLESLTDEQRRAAKRAGAPTSLRAVTRTGTDPENGS